ncbi:hypothetical protein [Hoeflea sp. AS16]|uniref:hypothetical protein n=1 Tax=Hoeflea sp. AS16 TaxID=3135779 RepID=UPI0031752366
MGIPQHYSLDIPARCLALLDLCEPVVKSAGGRGRFGGPLNTTLLLALATPMISLPIERIYKNIDFGDREGMVDDRRVNPQLAERLDAEIKRKTLRQNRYFSDLHWSFAKDVEIFNAAHPLSTDLADQLSSDDAHEAARSMEMAQFVSCLRNALAHGGIMYLDGDGQSSTGQADMLLFVSAKPLIPDPVFDEKKGKYVNSRPVMESMRLLRIPQEDFRTFLKSWVTWLNELGIIEDLDAA